LGATADVIRVVTEDAGRAGSPTNRVAVRAEAIPPRGVAEEFPRPERAVATGDRLFVAAAPRLSGADVVEFAAALLVSLADASSAWAAPAPASAKPTPSAPAPSHA